MLALGAACGGSAATDPPADAGNTVDASSGSDASGDASTPDTATDAGTSDGSFCAKNGAGHDLCEDFDRPLVIGSPSGFTRVQVMDEGARLVQENGALRGDILYLDGGPLGFVAGLAWVERSWPRLGDGSKPRIVHRYRLKVDDCPSGAHVQSSSMLGGNDLGPPYYTYSVSVLVYADIECKVRLRSYSTSEADGAPKPVDTLVSNSLTIATKQWLDVEFELKEAADGKVHAVLRVGGAEQTLDFDARSPSELIGFNFGVAKNELGNVHSRFFLDDILADYTKP